MNDRVRGGLAAAFLGVLLGGPATAAVTGFVNNPTTNSQDLANWVASHQGALNKTVDFSTHPLGPLQSGFYSSQGVTLTGTGVYTNVVFGAGPGQINPGTSPGEGPHAPSNFLGTSQITSQVRAGNLVITFAAPVMAAGLFTIDSHSSGQFGSNQLILEAFSGPDATGTLLGQFFSAPFVFQPNLLYFMGVASDTNNIRSVRFVNPSASQFLGDFVGIGPIHFASPRVVLLSGTLPSGTVGVAYSQTLAATGGTPPFTYSLFGGALPNGLTLSPTGVISGVPTAPGASSFRVRVSDSLGAIDTTSFSLAIQGAAMTLPAAAAGSPYSIKLPGTAQPPLPSTCSLVQGTLAPGLTLASDCTLSGTPSTAGTFLFVAQLVYASGVQNTTFSLLVNPALSLAPAGLPGGMVGTSYSQTLTGAGGSAPYTFSVSSGSLPGGLTLQPATNSPTALLAGVPTAAGTFSFAVQIRDSAGNVSVQTYTVAISGPFSITTTSLPAGTFGAAYSAAVAATGGRPPYTFALSAGALPGGLALAADGRITGTPNAAGSFTFTVQATDSNTAAPARDTHVYTLAIAPPAASQLTIVGPPDQVQPMQQPALGVQLSAPYPLPLTGTLTLTFSPDAVVPADDPNVVFSNGSRTATFTLAANTTQAVFSAPLLLQTGTVAGVIQIVASLQQGSTDVTPVPAPTRSLRMGRSAPGIASVLVVRNAAGFDVVATGFSNSREVTQARFRFTPSGTGSLQTTEVTLPVTPLFTTWYQNRSSTAFGSEFRFTQSFTVQGDAAALRSVEVTLTSGAGSSAPVSANY
ncbi:MAG: putative Ig domain-containing protein [Acidobacteria bacterium]|nr:putative Ig domain-containing protein [Acidobacteriota bacterium]